MVQGTTRNILPPNRFSPRCAACLQSRGFELQGAELASIQGSSDASLTQPEAEATEGSLEGSTCHITPNLKKKHGGGVPGTEMTFFPLHSCHIYWLVVLFNHRGMQYNIMGFVSQRKTPF